MSKYIDPKEALGKRCLVRKGYSSHYDEVRLVEISPSGKMVKLKWPFGAEMWEEQDEYYIEEILPEVNP